MIRFCESNSDDESTRTRRPEAMRFAIFVLD